MQGSHNNGRLHYRCRFSNEYAATSLIDHPRNVCVRQDAIEPHLDAWLAQVFDSDNVEQTCAALAAASKPDSDGETLARGTAQKAIKDCDRRLNQYRKLLDEGADPKIVASWMGEVQENRQIAEQALASLEPRQTLSEADVRHMIEQVEDAGSGCSQRPIQRRRATSTPPWASGSPTSPTGTASRSKRSLAHGA
jgi:site-specific DNA recombinase